MTRSRKQRKRTVQIFVNVDGVQDDPDGGESDGRQKSMTY